MTIIFWKLKKVELTPMPNIQCGDMEFSGQWSIWSLEVRYALSNILPRLLEI